MRQRWNAWAGRRLLMAERKILLFRYAYLRLIDVVYHSTLGVRVIKKKKKEYLGRKEVVDGAEEDVALQVRSAESLTKRSTV